MSTVTEVNVETGEVEERPLTAEEQAQRDTDRAEAAEREKAAAAKQAADDAHAARCAELAEKARAGTITTAERNEALALALTHR